MPLVSVSACKILLGGRQAGRQCWRVLVQQPSAAYRLVPQGLFFNELVDAVMMMLLYKSMIKLAFF
jgi:hypothetical protein